MNVIDKDKEITSLYLKKNYEQILVMKLIRSISVVDSLNIRGDRSITW